jgi:hypothetical protein
MINRADFCGDDIFKEDNRQQAPAIIIVDNDPSVMRKQRYEKLFYCAMTRAGDCPEVTYA